jgi:hypothetical protein
MGCCFHWFSKVQRSVTLSSAEAEYFGAQLAAKDTMWVRELLMDLGLLNVGPTLMWSDSGSAVDMAYDPVAFKKTKHILRAAHFLRDVCARAVISLSHLPGKVMIADLLTKAVSRLIFLELMALFDAYSTASTPDKPAVCVSDANPVARPGGAVAPAPTKSAERAAGRPESRPKP